MAYEFKRLADVEALSEVPENATVLAEVNGSIKRVPGNGLGGSGNGNGIVIVMDDPNASPRTLAAGPVTPVYTFKANMDFADAIAAFRNHEITSVVVYGLNSVMSPSSPNSTAGTVEDYQVMDIAAMADITSMAGIDCLMVNTLMSQMDLYWTASGISTEVPGNK